MRHINREAERSISVDDVKRAVSYSPETGLFTSLGGPGRAKRGFVLGQQCKRSRYFTISINKRKFLAHRVAWIYMTGSWPANLIDHIDGNRFNNSFSNLREVRQFENLQNIKTAHVGSVSGVLGVFRRNSGRYSASICTLGKNKCLGTFDTIEEASAAYLSAKKQHHPFQTIAEVTK